MDGNCYLVKTYILKAAFLVKVTAHDSIKQLCLYIFITFQEIESEDISLITTVTFFKGDMYYALFSKIGTAS